MHTDDKTLTEEDKQWLDAQLSRSGERMIERISKSEDHAIEAMRSMQTELLRGFEAFPNSQMIRLRKVEIDQSNLDATLSGRVVILENRLQQIELRLGLTGI